MQRARDTVPLRACHSLSLEDMIAILYRLVGRHFKVGLGSPMNAIHRVQRQGSRCLKVSQFRHIAHHSDVFTPMGAVFNIENQFHSKQF